MSVFGGKCPFFFDQRFREQTVLGISCREDDFEGLSSRIGITTPVRDFSVMTKEFGVAYIYGQDLDRIIVMNLSEKKIQIKRGTQVAEFHPRSPKDFILLSTQGRLVIRLGQMQR